MPQLEGHCVKHHLKQDLRKVHIYALHLSWVKVTKGKKEGFSASFLSHIPSSLFRRSHCVNRSSFVNRHF